MSTARAPDDPASIEWDVAVIGTGMGGSTSGYELARLGRRVLFIEKGHYLHGDERSGKPPEQAGGRELPHERLDGGWWPNRMQGTTSFGRVEFFPMMGCGTGGTTVLYGAGLERFFPADFSPRANFPDVPDCTLPERWPISYEELRPFYEKAEALFRVRGTLDPLRPDGGGSLREPPPLSERDQHLHDSLSRLGLHPYRHHAGYEFVPGCTGCAAAICPRQCKSDAGRLCLRPALERHGASILTDCEAYRLESSQDRVSAIHCRWKGNELVLRARVVVLAAGAFMTPVLLLNSASDEHPRGLANRSGLVGRNLMLHASDVFVMKPGPRLSDVGPTKSLALSDLYHSRGEKLGTFQMMGAPVTLINIMQFMRDDAERDPRWWKILARARPWWWRKLCSPLIRLAALMAYYVLDFRRATLWASTIEDLPYHDNRVIADPQASNGMRFEYRYPEELSRRVASFRRRIVRLLGPHKVFNLSGDSNINYGHVCGTCRFGDDPSTSVLDRNNRAHDVSNLYVVDASFFPSSGGINPTLTIAANALRVAGEIHRRMG